MQTGKTVLVVSSTSTHFSHDSYILRYVYEIFHDIPTTVSILAARMLSQKYIRKLFTSEIVFFYVRIFMRDCDITIGCNFEFRSINPSLVPNRINEQV